MPRVLRVVLVFALPVFAALALLAAFQLINDDGSDRAVAEQQLVRWGNVTLLVPTELTVAVSRDFWEGSPAVLLSSTGNRGGGIAIDAQSGAILVDTLPAEDRKAAQDILETLQLSAIDTETAPWPYYGSTIPSPDARLGDHALPVPDPASGFTVYESHGICPADVACSGPLTAFSNGASWIAVDPNTGLVRHEEVEQADEAVIQRLRQDLAEFVSRR